MSSDNPRVETIGPMRPAGFPAGEPPPSADDSGHGASGDAGKHRGESCPFCRHTISKAVFKRLCNEHKNATEKGITDEDRMLRFYWLMETKQDIIRWVRLSIVGVIVVLILAVVSALLPAYLSLLRSDALIDNANGKILEASKKLSELDGILRSDTVAQLPGLLDRAAEVDRTLEELESKLADSSSRIADLNESATVFVKQDIKGLEDRLRREIASLRSELASGPSAGGVSVAARSAPTPAPVQPVSGDSRLPTTVFDTQATLEWILPEALEGDTCRIDVWLSDPDGGAEPQPFYATGTRFDLKRADIAGFAPGRLWWRVTALGEGGAEYRGPVASFDLYRNALERILSRGEIRVGVSPSDDGLFVHEQTVGASSDSTNALSGFDIELTRWVAEELPSQLRRELETSQARGDDAMLVERFLREHGTIGVRYIRRDWNALFAALQSAEVDCIASGITATDARRERFSMVFTAPYYTTVQCAIIRKDRAPTHSSELAGKRFAIVKGTTSHAAAKLYRPQSIAQLDRTDQVLSAVVRGEAEVGFADYTFAWQSLKALGLSGRVELLALTPESASDPVGAVAFEEPYAMAVPDVDATLLAAINGLLQSDAGHEALRRMRARSNLPSEAPAAQMPAWSAALGAAGAAGLDADAPINTSAAPRSDP
ncbi:MAG: transporter substrate-binding domain-containing protein [Phycisphaeraceae bacterium]|nr:transporter substrate-binding domain-containing protein [Phycisphaeraceae bacterium]